jgi:hypothetical protein
MKIDNAERLITIFGRWPSFHDAEVVRVALDRSGDQGPTLEAVIHVCEYTAALDATGHYVTAKHTEVTFRFTDVELHSLQGFNEQNVLASLTITDIDAAEHEGRQLRIEMPTLYGLDAKFDCRGAAVISVRAWAPAV